MSGEERENRIQKINELKDLGIKPFIDNFAIEKDNKLVSKRNLISQIQYKQKLPDIDGLKEKGIENKYKLSGRLVLKREHGKLAFGRLKDFTGEIQIAFLRGEFNLFSGKSQITKIDSFEFVKKYLDIGDYIGVEGDLFLTKHGESTLYVNNLYFLSKTLRSMPEKFHGIGGERENRYRYRYLDFLVSDEKGEQKVLSFLRKDTSFKKFFLSFFQYFIEEDFFQDLKKIINFRNKKLKEEIPDIVKEFLSLEEFSGDFLKIKSETEIEKFYNYMFSIFIKVDRVRNYVMNFMKKDLRPQYLAAIFKMNTKERFRTRTKIINYFRNYLEKQDFVEIETPILTNKASGALAKPFKTYHEAFDMDVFLRIAPETYLKKAMVGGLEKVYEFARCFRNEGIDPSHIQDFTMLEFYRAYVDYKYLMEFTEKMFKDLLKDVFGSEVLIILDKNGDSQEVDFSKEWPQKTMFELINPYFPKLEELWRNNQLEKAKEIMKNELGEYLESKDFEEMEDLGWGNFVDFVYKKTARKKIIDPVFVVNHPLELSPLSRKNDGDERLVDRFQLVVNGWELVNAYSELIDPIDQMERFLEQQRAKDQGDQEAHEIDYEYVKAMEYGMPPMAGWGSGIDRLVALLTTQSNIKDVVMFPLMKDVENE